MSAITRADSIRPRYDIGFLLLADVLSQELPSSARKDITSLPEWRTIALNCALRLFGVKSGGRHHADESGKNPGNRACISGCASDHRLGASCGRRGAQFRQS